MHDHQTIQGQKLTPVESFGKMSKKNQASKSATKKLTLTPRSVTTKQKGFSMLSKKSNYHLYEISSPWLNTKYDQ